ncbi:MAG: c-type cytochrome [Gemmatimonadaceae bacterium]
MHRFPFLAAALSSIALAACSVGDDGRISSNPGAVLQPPTVSAATSRGAVLARDLCAQCHGDTFIGAATDDGTCPTLKLIHDYTFAEFEQLLVVGVARSGNEVDTLMKATQGLNAQDRAALFQYLWSVSPTRESGRGSPCLVAPTPLPRSAFNPIMET